MKNFAIGTALAVLAASIPAAAPAQRVNTALVAIVDTQRGLRECTACVAANQQLQTQVTALQQRAQQLGQPLQTEGQSIQTAIQALNGREPDAALQQRITAFEARQNSAQQEIQTQQQTLERNRQYVTQQIGTALDPILTEVMQARGANVVLDKNATMAAGASLEVTTDVLTRLNQRLPSVNTVAPAPTQQQPQGR